MQQKSQVLLYFVFVCIPDMGFITAFASGAFIFLSDDLCDTKLIINSKKIYESGWFQHVLCICQNVVTSKLIKVQNHNFLQGNSCFCRNNVK